MEIYLPALYDKKHDAFKFLASNYDLKQRKTNYIRRFRLSLF